MLISLSDRAVAGYEAAAETLIPRYDALDPAHILSPVLDLIPKHPAAVLDIGTGTGASAVWLAEAGHKVTAVEPCHRFRAHLAERATDIPIFDARLPFLDGVPGRFGMILAIGVWHHLDPSDRPPAWTSIAKRLAEDGLAVVSLRHGPSPDDRPGAPCLAIDEARLADVAGLTVVRQTTGSSVQPGNAALGVTWTWLCLTRKGPS